jgi:origin recognition complex subunit 5
LALHKAGVVYIHFPPYTRAQAVHIVTSRRATFLPSPLPEGTVVQTSEEVLAKIYTQFAITVYDTLISPTASTSIRKFQSTCNKLWPRFIWPLVSGQEGPGTGRARSWDFAKLLVHSRGLFQSAGEKALHHALPASVLDAPKMTELHPPQAPSTPSRRPSTPSKQPLTQETLTQPPLLKHFPTLVLLSCYLASHTLPKHDILLFSRLSSSSSTTSKKIRRLRQTPTKRKAATNTPNGTPSKGNAEATTPTKSRSSKSLFAATANLGIPRPFTLERLVAILRAVHPHGIPNRAGRGVSDRVYRELGELEKLRLVVRSSGSSGGGTTSTTTGGSADDSTEEKWRVNVRRDWAVNTGHAWGMGISEYETEQDL